MAKTVLLVEDKKLIRMMIINGLKGYGIDFLEASNGQEAVELFKERNDEIDLVISDINLPLLNGVDTIRTIKQIKPTLPCIVLTSFTHKTIVLECVRIGVAAFLAKPLHMETLKEKVFDLLNVRERQSEISITFAKEERPVMTGHNFNDLRSILVDLAEAAG